MCALRVVALRAVLIVSLALKRSSFTGGVDGKPSVEVLALVRIVPCKL